MPPTSRTAHHQFTTSVNADLGVGRGAHRKMRWADARISTYTTSRRTAYAFSTKEIISPRHRSPSSAVSPAVPPPADNATPLPPSESRRTRKFGLPPTARTWFVALLCTGRNWPRGTRPGLEAWGPEKDERFSCPMAEDEEHIQYRRVRTGKERDGWQLAV